MQVLLTAGAAALVFTEAHLQMCTNTLWASLWVEAPIKRDTFSSTGKFFLCISCGSVHFCTSDFLIELSVNWSRVFFFFFIPKATLEKLFHIQMREHIHSLVVYSYLEKVWKKKGKIKAREKKETLVGVFPVQRSERVRGQKLHIRWWMRSPWKWHLQ